MRGGFSRGRTRLLTLGTKSGSWLGWPFAAARIYANLPPLYPSPGTAPASQLCNRHRWRFCFRYAVAIPDVVDPAVVSRTGRRLLDVVVIGGVFWLFTGTPLLCRAKCRLRAVEKSAALPPPGLMAQEIQVPKSPSVGEFARVLLDVIGCRRTGS